MKDCFLYEEYCSAYLDNELTAEEQARLLAHLTICPDCETYLEELRALRAKLSPENVSAPADLHETVMQPVLAEAQSTVFPPTKRRRHPPVFTMIAAAAVVVLLATTGKLGDVLSSVPGPSSSTNPVSGNTTGSASTAALPHQPILGGDSSKMTAAAPKAASSSSAAAASSVISISDVPGAVSSQVYAYCYVAQGSGKLPDFGGTLSAQSSSGKISYFTLHNNMSALEKALGKLQSSGFESQLHEDVGGITLDSKSETGLIIVVQAP